MVGEAGAQVQGGERKILKIRMHLCGSLINSITIGAKLNYLFEKYFMSILCSN